MAAVALTTASGLPDVGNLAKTISGAGHTTNMDINVAKMIEAADPNYTESALREIIRQQRWSQMDVVNHHNALVDRFGQIAPDNAKAAGFYRVDLPQTAFPAAERVPVGGSSTPSAGGGAPVRVQSPADVATLPSGTQFITPDGRLKVKP